MASDFSIVESTVADVPVGDGEVEPDSWLVLLTVIAVAAVFVTYSLIVVPPPGVNEPHYLTKARSFADPEWCGKDFFLDSADAHAVFFFFVGPLTKQLSFETVAVTGRVLSLLLLACGWVMLGRRLGLNLSGVVAAAATLCLIAMTGNFSGEWVIGGFESKVPAYGFAFVGVAWWLDAGVLQNIRSYLKSAAMIGLAISWHPVVGAWFAIGMCLAEVVVFVGFRSLAQTSGRLVANGLASITAVTVFALPGLIPALRLVLASDVEPAVQDTANKIQVFWRLAHHLDPSTFPIYSWVHVGVLLCIVVAGFVLLYRFRKIPGNFAVDHQRNAWLMLAALLGAALLIALAGVLTGWHSTPFPNIPGWEWRARILRYYPFRFLDALLPCVCALLVGVACSRVIARPEIKVSLWCFAVVPVLVFAPMVRQSVPRSYSVAAYSQWKLACEWIRLNTAADSLILAPRESFGLKWFAERAEYVCVKDCPQDASGIVEWNQRLWRLHRWSESSYQDKQFDNSDLVRLHKLTQVNYILTRKLGPFEAEPVYQNDWWRIYKVPSENQ